RRAYSSPSELGDPIEASPCDAGHGVAFALRRVNSATPLKPPTWDMGPRVRRVSSPSELGDPIEARGRGPARRGPHGPLRRVNSATPLKHLGCRRTRAPRRGSSPSELGDPIEARIEDAKRIAIVISSPSELGDPIEARYCPRPATSSRVPLRRVNSATPL